MAGSFVGHSRKPVLILRQLLTVHVAKSSHLRQHLRQGSDRFLTFRAPEIVFTACVFMFHHRITDNQVNVFGKGEKPEIQRPAIQQEGVPDLAMTSDELVHDAAARSYE